jgi:hypothetical protein
MGLLGKIMGAALAANGSAWRCNLEQTTNQGSPGGELQDTFDCRNAKQD